MWKFKLQKKPGVTYRAYSPSAMTSAYIKVMEMSGAIRKVAREYNVPESTLRNRIRGHVDPDTTRSGPEAIFRKEEEFKYSDGVDKILLFVGSLIAVATGSYFPFAYFPYADIVSGMVYNAMYRTWNFTAMNDTSSTHFKFSPAEVSNIYNFVTDTYTPQLFAIGATGVLLAAAQYIVWTIAGARQMAKIRRMYFKAVIHQTVSWFDENNAREISARFSVLYPVVPTTTRKALQDDNINGLAIPAGTKIVLHMGALHRSEENWADPEKFNPDRFSEDHEPYTQLPFITGPYMCIGHKFATLEMKTVVTFLLREFVFSLVPGYKFRRIQALSVKPHPPLVLNISRYDGK